MTPSFFIWRERRWLRAVLTRGHTEPTELWTALIWCASGLTLLNAPGSLALSHPAFYGAGLLVISLLGGMGLALRHDGLRVAFGMGGFFLSFWMALLYLVHDQRDPQWLSCLAGAIIMAWIFLRIVCRRGQ